MHFSKCVDGIDLKAQDQIGSAIFFPSAIGLCVFHLRATQLKAAEPLSRRLACGADVTATDSDSRKASDHLLNDPDIEQGTVLPKREVCKVCARNNGRGVSPQHRALLRPVEYTALIPISADLLNPIIQ